MNLDTYEAPEDLYLARGDEVNLNRPLFSGDIFSEVYIPGVEDDGPGIIIAHPCSFRAKEGQLTDRLLVARVRPSTAQGANAWRRGFLDKMPLPDFNGTGHWVAHLMKSVGAR